MEPVVISSGRHGQAIRVRQADVGRRRVLGATPCLFVLIATVACLYLRVEARGQALSSQVQPPPSPLADEALTSRDTKGLPRIPSPRLSSHPAAGPTAPAEPVPVSAAAADETNLLANRRFKVRDEYGDCVVARFHGQYGGRTALLLPDGQICTPNRLIPTDEPFQPLTALQLQTVLHNGPFAEYHLLNSERYLIFYKSSLPFAQDSGRLLDDLYDGLLDAFRRNGFPVHETEFPLVAVIFATESDFRAHKHVDPQVQAYYEFFTNRIFFYQKSARDQLEPKLSSLLKPQTVTHEGAHQILSNIGLQPRPSSWPLWLVEGLAEYAATVTTKKGIGWSGMGAINSLHMATLRELDDPLSNMVNASAGHAVKDPRQRWAIHTELLLLKSALTPTDYAESWVLTHYLAKKRGPDFVKYLKAMSQVPPLEPRTPLENLAVFRQFFDDEPTKLDKKLDEHIRKLSQNKTYDRLPFYTVIFAQPLGAGLMRRAARVSQSPQMIEQWVQEMTAPQGGEPNWEAIPWPTYARALLAAEDWMRRL